ncbi:MAG: MBG domain-containing protein, partial [bacterium]
MIIKISSRVMALALLFAVPLALHATPIQPTVITKWYSGVNDAATLGIQTGAGGLTGRHVQWEDTEVKPTHPGQIMGLEQTVGVIQYRSAPLLQGHGLYSFNDAFGTDSDQMPSNSVITSARLWLYVTSFASTQTITVAGLAPLNRDWIENSACYSYQSNFTPWVGGTFTGAVLKSYATIPNPTAVGWMSIDIAEPIRDYVTNVIGSVALLSQNNQAANVQNAYFASDENDNPKWAPGMRSTFWLLYSPNRLPASDIWAQKFTANWERVLGVGVTITNYHLDVATDPRFYQTVGIYSNLEMGAALSCVVTGLTENTTYYYRLHCHLGRVVSFFNVNTLVQTRRLQTLVFPPISSQWVGNVVSLLATTESGLTPTFTVVDGPGIIAGLNQLSFSGTGMVSVVASQLGDPFWDPALPPVTNTFLVYKNAQAITSFTALGTHRNTEIVHMSATASSGLPVSFAVGSGLGVITSGNILSFTGTGLVQVVASQAGDFYYLAAAPVTNDCPVYGTVTTNTGNAGMALSGLSVVYDGTPHPVTVVTDPLGLSNDVTYIDDPVVAPAGNTNPPVNAGTYNVFAW